MANVVYEDRMYNVDTKDDFMKNYSENTQNILKRIFKISCAIETELDKDLYDFNRDELRRLFFLFAPRTLYSSKANISWVAKYLDWSIDKGYLTINPLKTVTNEWKEQFVVKTLKIFWTDREIRHILENRVNSQDAVIISLLFNGAKGKMSSEILKLRKQDIDEKNQQLTLTDFDDSTRIITVDETCINYCLKAVSETEYQKMNGLPDPDVKAVSAQLIENDFVVRPANTRTIHIEEAEKNIIYRRLTKVADELGEPNFNPKNIFQSGMLYYAKELYFTTGFLDKEEYKLIFEKFNETSIQSQYRFKHEFLNEKTIKEFYNLS